MGSDAIGPRTWLLVALAGWALLAWLLALFGMGGVIRPLPADPSLVRSLPQLQAPAAERLGPLAQYSGMSARPLFSENRQPEPFFISGEQGEQSQTFDFVLSSVLISPGLQLAILQPRDGGESVRVKLGEAPEPAPIWRVIEIRPRSVVIAGPEGQQTLELRVFDGSGGQPPTASQSGAAAIQPMPGGPVASGQSPKQVPTPAAPGLPAQPASTEGMPAPVPNDASAEPVLTTEQQMDLIRKRIEARRAQLREQGELPPTPEKTK